MNWTITGEFSDMVNRFAIHDSQVLWEVDHLPTDQLHVDSMETDKRLVFSSDNLADNFKYVFTQEVSNEQRTYY